MNAPIGGIQHPHLDTYSNQEINHGTSPDKHLENGLVFYI